jgi:hypothetical protein
VVLSLPISPHSSNTCQLNSKASFNAQKHALTLSTSCSSSGGKALDIWTKGVGRHARTDLFDGEALRLARPREVVVPLVDPPLQRARHRGERELRASGQQRLPLPSRGRLGGWRSGVLAAALPLRPLLLLALLPRPPPPPLLLRPLLPPVPARRLLLPFRVWGDGRLEKRHRVSWQRLEDLLLLPPTLL